MKRLILAGSLIASIVGSALPAPAATLTQSTAAVEKARADAAKARAASAAKAASQAAALAHRDAAAQDKTLIKIKSNVLIETRARIEAANKAAQVNAAIIAAGDAAPGGPALHGEAPAFKHELRRLGDRHWGQRGEGLGAHPRLASHH